MKKSVCNSKQKWNLDGCRCECKELDDWSSCNDGYRWNPSTCNWECNKVCKINKYLHIKHCSCEIPLFCKLVIAYEDGILNTTVTSPVDERVTCAKNNCLIYTISLVIICLLLLVTNSISWHYYYTTHCIRKKCSSS